ncbi:MAG: 50S ribosomal protein L21 [Coriobacteriia bacterium]|nr:50S ribosomal protein L21 [Coriobacteriia bacterium]
MYAVVATGGKQLKVVKDDLAVIEKLDAAVGDTVELPVLMFADGGKIVADPTTLAGATVTVTVVEHKQGDKQMVFKFKKRKGYKRLKGHRQWLTVVRIGDIAMGGEKKAAPAKAEKKVASAKPTPKADAAVEKSPVAVAAAVEPGQCAALKADGTQCANKTKEGSEYCGVHAKKYEG